MLHFGKLQQASLESVYVLLFHLSYLQFNMQLPIHSVFNTHIRRHCSHPPHLDPPPPSPPQSVQQRHWTQTQHLFKRLVLFNPYIVLLSPMEYFFLYRKLQKLKNNKSSDLNFTFIYSNCLFN